MEPKSFFTDPVHGQIYLTDLERAVIDTITFQRLRFIRQLGLLHYVFPGSFHSRFSHSIGTCHNAGLIATQLFPWIKDHSKNYIMQIFRLAALLHDIGHGAFSHTLSRLSVNGSPFLPTIKSVLDNPIKWGLSSSPDDPLITAARDTFKDNLKAPLPHELLSVILIKNIIEQISEGTRKYSGSDLLMHVPFQNWIQDICSLIFSNIAPSITFIDESIKLFSTTLAEIPSLNEDPKKKCSPNIKFVLSSLVSGTVDVDRMDYLFRDSINCGVNYGFFDKDGIISAILLVIDGGEFKFALNAKRANTVDDFLWSRYQMFRQVYCHKTNQAYNLLLELAMGDLAKENIIKRPECIEDFLLLTDDYIMSRVFEEVQTSNKKTWVRAFAKRQLPKFLGAYESDIFDPIWDISYREIYEKSNLPKYPHWKDDPDLRATSLKTEAICSTMQKEPSLPLLVYYDKQQKKWTKRMSLSRSVFFKNDLDQSLRLKELARRLNKKIMFFYKM